MTKPNLYDTLGVKPDATPAELKRARRRRAAEAHPDKATGNHDEMAAINKAYDTLSDPARRLLYDTTGEDSRPPEEVRVSGLVMQAFMDALVKDAPNVVKGAQQFLDNAKLAFRQQKTEGERALKSLRERRDKVTTKSPLNAFHLIVDQQIVSIEQKLASLDVDVETCDKALKELKSYKSSEKMIEVVSFQLGGYGTATTGGQW